MSQIVILTPTLLFLDTFYFSDTLYFRRTESLRNILAKQEAPKGRTILRGQLQSIDYFFRNGLLLPLDPVVDDFELLLAWITIVVDVGEQAKVEDVVREVVGVDTADRTAVDG